MIQRLSGLKNHFNHCFSVDDRNILIAAFSEGGMEGAENSAIDT
jgi:hypothetical protein